MPPYPGQTTLTELQYEFPSYGGRCRAKMTWPLVLVNIRSSQCTDAYLAHSVEADMRHEFAAQPENVRSAASRARPPITDDLPIPHENSSLLSI